MMMNTDEHGYRGKYAAHQNARGLLKDTQCNPADHGTAIAAHPAERTGTKP